MATEKKSFTDVLGAGRVPALTLVPPVPGYLPPENIEVTVDGRRHDVLGFSVEGARALMVKAGFDPIMGRGNRTLELTYHIAALSDYKLRGEMLQQQWHRNLGIRVNLAVHEFSLHWKMVLEGDYSGAADYGFLMTYFDPNPYLDLFLTAGVGNPTGWTRFRLCIDARRCESHIGSSGAHDQAGELRKAPAPGDACHSAVL